MFRNFSRVFLLLSLFSFLFNNCGNRDDSHIFNPPEWIKGTWGSNGFAKYHFSKDDFVVDVQGRQFSYRTYIKGNNARINIFKNSPTEYGFEIIPSSTDKNNTRMRSGILRFYFKIKSNNILIDNNNLTLYKMM